MPIFTFLRRVCRNSSSCWSIFCKWSENIFRCVMTEVCSRMSYPTGLENDTLCNLKTHVHIWERGGKFTDVRADWLHTAITQSDWKQPLQTVCKSEENSSKSPTITQHSHLSGWCQGPVHVEQAEDVPIRREAVRFFHVSVYFLWVCPLAECGEMKLVF